MSETSRHGAGEPLAARRRARARPGPVETSTQLLPVSASFVVLYALAYVGTILLFLAPLLVACR